MKNLFTIIIVFLLSCKGLMGLNIGDVTIQRISAPYFGLDNLSPCTESPGGAYVAYRITNMRSFPLTGLYATLDGFSHPEVMLGGGQDAYQDVGLLMPGHSAVVYWYVFYPCTPSISVNMTVSVGDWQAGEVTHSASTLIKPMQKTTRVGNIVDTAWVGIPMVGGLISFEVTYAFGGSKAGDSFDFQPTGQADFDASSLQLIRTEVLSSAIPGISPNLKDSLYFIGGNKGGSANWVKMRYTFRVGDNLVNYVMHPYASQSGVQHHTYTGNFPFVGSYSNVLPFQLRLKGNVTPGVGCGMITYQITVINTSDVTHYFDNVIVDLAQEATFLSTLNPPSSLESLTQRPIVGTSGILTWRVDSLSNAPGVMLVGNDSITFSFTAAINCGVDISTTPFTSGLRLGNGSYTMMSVFYTTCYQCASIFPVVLSQFEGKWQLGKVLLSWQTESEKNNLGFSVERSEDGYIYEVIGFVPSASNSDVVQKYTFEDEDSRYAKERKMHYRLKIIDIDGTFEYSPVVEMLEPENSKQSPITFTLSPNPVEAELTIISSLHTAMATTLTISDVSGHTLINKYYTSEEVAEGVKIDVSGLPRGIYIINMYEKGEHNHQLFTKQ